MIISVINQKGGVGKTTTAVNLSKALTLFPLSKKVLLIDLDPQANATIHLGERVPFEKSVSQIFRNQCSLKDLIVPIDGIDLIPSHISLSGAERNLNNEMSREYFLRNALDEVVSDYDFILIDCPPSLNLLSINALACSDGVIVPVKLESFAMEALGDFFETFFAVRNKLNKNIKISGCLVTEYNQRLSMTKEFLSGLRTKFEGKMFETLIRTDSNIKKAQQCHKDVFTYNRQAKTAIDYKSLADEIVRRNINV